MGSAVSRRNRPPPACRTHIRTLQGEARLTAHRHRQSFAVGDPASSPPAPPHGKHRFAPCPRTRPAGHAYARSRGKHGSLPTDTGSPFAVINPANPPPAPPHRKCLSRLRLSALSHASGRAAPHRRPILRTAKSRTHPGVCPAFYGIRRGYALAERI